jgi:hypothetical protein
MFPVLAPVMMRIATGDFSTSPAAVYQALSILPDFWAVAGLQQGLASVRQT